MYSEDSLFTLSLPGQIGLIALSVTLAAGLVYALRRSTAQQPLPVRIAIALMVFWGFVWLSPQIYYIYYRLIIDGLPAQWVIGRPPEMSRIAQILLFFEAPTLAAHSQALLGWTMMIAAAKCRNAAN